MGFDTPGSYTSLEDGGYVLRLMKLEDTEDRGFGPGNKWVWHVYYEQTKELIRDDEDNQPYEFFSFSSAKVGPKSKAGKWFNALLGRDLQKGENPQAIVNEAMGKYMKALIGNVEEDGITRTKILNCSPMPKASNGTAQQAPPPTPEPEPVKEPVGVGATGIQQLNDESDLPW